MVQVFAVLEVDVQRDFGIERHRAEEIFQEVQVKVRDPRPLERDVEHQVRPPGDVHRGVHEGLVHGNNSAAVAHEPRPVADGFLERLPHADPHVFYRVVKIHLGVSAGVDGEVHEPVLGPRLQHVVEERDCGLHF